MTFQEQLKEEKNAAIKQIAEYLLTREDIKHKLDNPKKSLKEMFDYIVSEAKKQANNGCACVGDEEVFGWAVHYYDEEKVEFKKASLESVTMTKEKPKAIAVKPKEEKKEVKKKVSDVAEGQVSLF